MVLYLLLQEPSYGYELAKRIKETSSRCMQFSRDWRKMVWSLPFMEMKPAAKEGPIIRLLKKEERITKKNVLNGH